MIKLLNHRATDPITDETIAAYTAAMHTAKNLLPEPIVVSDVEFNKWEKLGEAKRRDCRLSMPIMKEHGTYLQAPLSIAYAENKLKNYDAYDALIEVHQKIIADLQRRKSLEGIGGLNMVKICEEETYNKAYQGNPDAIEAANKLDKIPRFYRNGNTGKEKGKENPPTPSGN
jgi:hypothetical protein